MKMDPRYLGDGAYAHWCEGRLVLTTGNHEPALADNTIVLEPEVLVSLLMYLKKPISIMKLRSCFHIAKTTSQFIAIVDEDRGLSVTNDAEAVVAHLIEHEGATAKRIFYRDTDGKWDELLHNDGKFVDFAPIKAEERAGLELPE
jgi:hypothetical protein